MTYKCRNEKSNKLQSSAEVENQIFFSVLWDTKNKSGIFTYNHFWVFTEKVSGGPLGPNVSLMPEENNHTG